jgi:hypothetical protein
MASIIRVEMHLTQLRAWASKYTVDECFARYGNGDLTFHFLWFYSQELESLKERNATLQIQVLHLQEELNETQSKIRKAREMIKLYNKTLKETMASSMRPHDLNYAQKVPRNREEENELLKVRHCSLVRLRKGFGI